jgi:hypothetical protein
MTSQEKISAVIHIFGDSGENLITLVYLDGTAKCRKPAAPAFLDKSSGYTTL